MHTLGGSLHVLIFGILLNSCEGTGPVKISRSAITVSSHGTAYSDWIADRVNDGVAMDPKLHNKADECSCCAALQRPSWVQLTLDKIYFVERILVLGRIELGTLQFNDIFLSLGLLDESLQIQAFTLKNSTIAEMFLNPPSALQVVRVTGNSTDGTNYTTICEIMIYRQADCQLGSYGANCSKTCHCRAGACDSVTGVCIDNVCKDGWTGIACNKTCGKGFFGVNCSLKCHCQNEAICDPLSGYCANDQCAPGWSQRNCSVLCEPRTYGPNCVLECHCDWCDNNNGSCAVYKKDCHYGFRLKDGLCQACEPGTYGPNCSLDCHCDWCHHVNGSCVVHNQVCYSGYQQRNGLCTADTEKGVTDTTLLIGIIVTGSTLGVLIVIDVVVVTIYIYRRKGRNAGGTPDNTYDTVTPTVDAGDRYEGLQMTSRGLSTK